jgi:multiple sugar transport system substrate-binding protein
MRGRAVVLAAAIVMAPLGAEAADLVVWWEKGFYPLEDGAIREIIAAFEQETGREVELLQPAYDETFDSANAALEAGTPPDFLLAREQAPVWAYEDQLIDLTEALGLALGLFDADAIEAATLLNGRTGKRGLYALPMGRRSNHLHVWRSLLEQAGFTLDDVPKEWQAFWSFWCDDVQPAVREATGRDDIWGIGLPMSSTATDTLDQLVQFQLAYGTPWIDRERHLQVDDPKLREGMVRALDAYAVIWRKGCTPPESVSWNNVDNNTAFLAQTVVMTPNTSLLIPGALKRGRPDAYYEDAVTID